MGGGGRAGTVFAAYLVYTGVPVAEALARARGGARGGASARVDVQRILAGDERAAGDVEPGRPHDVLVQGHVRAALDRGAPTRLDQGELAPVLVLDRLQGVCETHLALTLGDA